MTHGFTSALAICNHNTVRPAAPLDLTLCKLETWRTNMSRKRTLSPASRAVPGSALVAAVSSLGLLLGIPECASAKTKAPKVFINTTSGKHIPEGKITVRSQGAGQQPPQPSGG